MLIDGLRQFKGKRVLLLQGPVGLFFSRLAKDLNKIGAHVYKINFNGGDFVFYPFNAINYSGNIENFPQFFQTYVIENNIDIVLLFGDSREIHKIARNVAYSLQLQVGVFEEGYLRPDFITFEEFGVNGNSVLPQSKQFYKKLPERKSTKVNKLNNTFWYAAMWAMIYNFFGMLLTPYFNQYQHHKPLTIWQGLYWIRSLFRKLSQRRFNLIMNRLLTKNLSRQFFLVPLQLSSDIQISAHSSYISIESFIDEVITSFSKNADENKVLVIKVHPFDRGFNDYSDFIKKIATICHVSERVYYVDSVHLPSMLKHALGVIVINSTVGISAIGYNLPVKALGKAIYNFEGLTFQGSLAEFWKHTELFHPDKLLIDNFIAYLLSNTQINGNFYKRLSVSKFYCGLRWRKLSPRNRSNDEQINKG